jgi:hypothetical protein
MIRRGEFSPVPRKALLPLGLYPTEYIRSSAVSHHAFKDEKKKKKKKQSIQSLRTGQTIPAKKNEK